MTCLKRFLAIYLAVSTPGANAYQAFAAGIQSQPNARLSHSKRGGGLPVQIGAFSLKRSFSGVSLSPTQAANQRAGVTAAVVPTVSGAASGEVRATVANTQANSTGQDARGQQRTGENQAHNAAGENDAWVIAIPVAEDTLGSGTDSENSADATSSQEAAQAGQRLASEKVGEFQAALTDSQHSANGTGRFLGKTFDLSEARGGSAGEIVLAGGDMGAPNPVLLLSHGPRRTVGVAAAVDNDATREMGSGNKALGKAAWAGGMALLAAGSLPVLSIVFWDLPGISSYQGAYAPLVFAGVALLAAARYLGRAKTDEPLDTVSIESEQNRAGLVRRILAWAMPSLSKFPAVLAQALRFHRDIDGRVGERSGENFFRWVRSGFRAAFLIATVALLAMFVASITQIFMQAISINPEVAGTAVGEALSDSNWVAFFAEQTAFVVAQEAVMLLGVFSGAHWLMKRLGKAPDSWANWAAALAAIGANLVYGVYIGYPPAMLPALLAIEVTMVYAFAKTRSFLIPGLAAGGIRLLSLYAGRLVGFLQSEEAGVLAEGALPAEWTYYAIAGFAAAVFLAMAWMRHKRPGFLMREILDQDRNLTRAGAWWNSPSVIPKAILPLIAISLFWAVPLNIMGNLTTMLVSLVAPATEYSEIALRLVRAPMDVLIAQFFIVAAMEELLFRMGVSKRIHDGLEGRLSRRNQVLMGAAKPARSGAGSRLSLIFTAGVISAIIFSLVHFIPLPLPALGEKFVSTYSFQWSTAVALFMMGVFLSYLYHRSKTIMIPLLAHWFSNSYEGMQVQWGLVPFLAIVAGSLLLHRFVRNEPERWEKAERERLRQLFASFKQSIAEDDPATFFSFIQTASAGNVARFVNGMNFIGEGPILYQLIEARAEKIIKALAEHDDSGEIDWNKPGARFSRPLDAANKRGLDKSVAEAMSQAGAESSEDGS